MANPREDELCFEVADREKSHEMYVMFYIFLVSLIESNVSFYVETRRMALLVEKTYFFLRK